MSTFHDILTTFKSQLHTFVNPVGAAYLADDVELVNTASDVRVIPFIAFGGHNPSQGGIDEVALKLDIQVDVITTLDNQAGVNPLASEPFDATAYYNSNSYLHWHDTIETIISNFHKSFIQGEGEAWPIEFVQFTPSYEKVAQGLTVKAMILFEVDMSIARGRSPTAVEEPFFPTPRDPGGVPVQEINANINGEDVQLWP